MPLLRLSGNFKLNLNHDAASHGGITTRMIFIASASSAGGPWSRVNLQVAVQVQGMVQGARIIQVENCKSLSMLLCVYSTVILYSSTVTAAMLFIVTGRSGANGPTAALGIKTARRWVTESISLAVSCGTAAPQVGCGNTGNCQEGGERNKCSYLPSSRVAPEALANFLAS